MTKNLLHLLILISFSCSSIRVGHYVLNEGEFDIKESDFIGKSYIDTTRFFYEGIESISTYAYNYEEKRSKMLVGKQIQFFESGQIKHIGNFKIGSYVNCCMGGPCMIYYPYKSGHWKYYYDDGQLKASGTYVNALEHINTSCKGGDDHYTNRIDTEWTFYDEEGNSIKPNEDLVKEIEFLDVFYNYL